VLAHTVERARRAGLSVGLVEELGDIDRPDDLPDWDRIRAARERVERIVAIVPTYQERESIELAVRALLVGGVDEIVVADGGSTDGTGRKAAAAGARVIDAPRGRASQMNEGARLAKGDALMFIHADTVVPPHAAQLVRATLRDPDVVAGAFDFAVPPGGMLERIVTVGARARCRLTGYPYGDQGLFLRSRTFRALGGFPVLPVMEDWELVHRLRRLGRVAVCREPAVTSARAFRTHGLALASAVNVAVIVAYQLGADPHRLARWRRRLASRARDASVP
jgi:hypothetical protein